MSRRWYALPLVCLGALVAARLSTDGNAENRTWPWVAAAAVGLVATVVMALGLRRVHRLGARDQRSGATLRDAALDLAGARDLAEIRTVTLARAGAVAGGELAHVAWLVANGRSAVSPLEILGPNGPMRREDVDLDGVLARLEGLAGGWPGPETTPATRWWSYRSRPGPVHRAPSA